MIIGLGGKLSGGKTITGIKYCFNQGLKGKKIISNIYLKLPPPIKTDFMSSNAFVDFIKVNFESGNKLKERFYNSVIFMDEIVGILSSRKSSSNLNEMVTDFFMMCGKMNADVVFTYQNYESQVDTRLRSVLEKQGFCMRLADDKTNLNQQERIVQKPIKILVIWREEYGYLGKKVFGEIYDPSPYYKFYDTQEVTLMDRSDYVKGGSKDLSKKFKIASLGQSTF
jgi:hypothetical protein